MKNSWKLCFALAALPAVAAAADNAQDFASRAEVEELRAIVKKLEARLAAIEQNTSERAAPHREAVAEPPAAANALPSAGAGQSAPEPLAATAGTSVNFAIDGYYGYNFNSPIGRANLLRAYDVSSNNFSLNQASVVFENAPDPDHGKRFGARLDLQWGQATQTLQGNAANEPRPDIYRAIFQAYGTYVAPVAKGLTIDFGKWYSSIGPEGNYTKDQIDYSRSFWFDYLPFYHMGVRANLKVTDAFSVNYWVTNGTQQTEAFNGFKDELFGFTLSPRKNLNWTFNYYLGQEHPDVVYYLNGNAPAGAPTQQGVPFEPIRPAPRGRLNIFDSYASLQATPKLDFTIESDWIVERYQRNSAPDETMGGAAYARYRFTPKFYAAARAEYLNDRNGLFTGAPQSLKETTLTANYQFGNGFMMFWEWRRDMSNQRYFYTDQLGLLANRQSTATVGLVWWFGPKQGPW